MAQLRTQEDWAAAVPNLRRVGAELVGPCPSCGGEDRFRIAANGKAFCRRCCPDGSSASMTALRRIEEIVGFKGAPGRRSNSTTKPPAISEPSKATPKRDHSAYGLRLLVESEPLAGTLADKYLSTRGLSQPVMPDWCRRARLRFHPRARCWVGGTRQHPIFDTFPALICPASAGVGQPPAAVHAVMLTPDGRKADIKGAAKRTFGSVRGLAAWLGDDSQPETILLCEGVENALSAAVLAQCDGIETAHPVACFGDAGFAHFNPPEGIKRVVAFMDSDRAGYVALAKLRQRCQTVDIEVETRSPNIGADANDELRSLVGAE